MKSSEPPTGFLVYCIPMAGIIILAWALATWHLPKIERHRRFHAVMDAWDSMLEENDPRIDHIFTMLILGTSAAWALFVLWVLAVSSNAWGRL